MSKRGPRRGPRPWQARFTHEDGKVILWLRMSLGGPPEWVALAKWEASHE